MQVKLPESSRILNGAPVLLERIAGALPAHLTIGNSVSIIENRELTLNVINVSKKHAVILKGRPLALATLCKNISAEQEEAERNEDRAKTTGKKNGKLRICIDYRRLNNTLKKNRYPLPRLDHILTKLQAKRWFSSLDLHQGFYQVLVRLSDRDILAFVTADGQYTYLKMPMGISTASSIFQRSMDVMLAGMGSFVKCSWASESLLYLGHIIDTNGLRPNPAKIETIFSAPDPKSKKDVKRLIGLASFYRRFIPSFSQVMYPISSLLRKNTPFVWEELQKQAFAKLKEALTSEPVLRHPDFDRDFLVKPDASSDAIGAVLAQKDEEGHERPIAFASRTMTDLEKKWSIMEREALALVYAVDVFKAYLYGRRFIVITDHRSLQHIHMQKDSQPRVMRWSLKLAIYEFEVQHRAGASHLDADAIS
uniref:Reverse transcriptase RNase H-like domain-containing protein n=1 Tax=Chromera velia CCMP2878 TaxID=1169474 RepID=A0A0G4I064_9ALVE|eukprot:Cvel_1612.t1-p1 / transcript=Cvel_1612.t1 / gene=Cvel_1612 / organism=Chromera_velia_CCMP2878 / gene_product=Retrovirus-related Pol polyprotein from transposon, putative / transcript_product=Retrovirus-related Pol polyprotein from transposon, putative / location=Cvel_scaffold57:137923-139692(-) / protein_length=422 / sequence_SO=supercontig / SO=protein_coding / is_pseudo=false